MKLKVGDKVKIKNNIHTGMKSVISAMLKYAGIIATINEVGDSLEWYGVEENKFIWDEETLELLTLKELYFRTGNVVELRDGSKYIVLRDGDKVALANLHDDCSFCSWCCFDKFDDDLNFTGRIGDSHYDIMKVYDRVCRWKDDYLSLLWEREEVKVKKMTMKEIEELVGSKVELVDDDEDDDDWEF